MTSHPSLTLVSFVSFVSLVALVAPACGTDDAATDTDASSGTTSTATTGTAGTADPTDSSGTSGDAPTTDPTGATTSGTTTDDTTTGIVADCGFDDTVEFARDGLVWQLESEDGTSCVWLKRRNDSEPDIIYKAVPFTLLAWKSGHDGALAHVTEADKLTWESTHHNWMDVATATDATVVYRLEDLFPLDPVDEDYVDHFGLSALDAVTDELLWGPITVYPHKP